MRLVSELWFLAGSNVVSFPHSAMAFTRSLLLLVVLGATFILATTIRRCPGYCRCFENGDPERTITVDCSNQDLVEIPYPLPSRTSHLDASGNLIQYVRSIDFSPEDEYLKILQLQNNDLLMIQSRAFKRLPNLEILILSNNNKLGARGEIQQDVFYNLRRLRQLDIKNLGLRSLPSGLFTPLTQLVQLDVSHNDLTEVSTDDFADLPRLKQISLSHNFIVNLRPSSFSNLPFLVKLDLSGNNIPFITNGTFSDIPRLRILNLTDNPLECGCHVMYLHDYARQQNLASPICRSPVSLRGVALLSLNTSQICLAPVVQLLPELPVLVLAANSALSLSCNSSGVPPPDIAWSFNGMSITSNNEQVIINGPSLSVLETLAGDSGTYRCIASSEAGTVSSSLQVLVLNETLPTNVTRILGSDVLLACGDVTHGPGLPITWFRNGTMVGVASERFAVTQDGNLLIRGVEFADVGTFTCDIGGQVAFDSNIDILAPPEIVSITEQCSTPGVVVVRISLPQFTLQCIAQGSPLPSVQWVVDGRMVSSVITENAPLVEANFTVVDIQLFGGEGEYTCVANNSLGTTSRTLRLVLDRDLTDAMSGQLMTLFHRTGDNVVLNCPLTQPNLLWFRDNRLRVVEDERRMFVCDNNAGLIIRNVSLLEDTGIYQCASNVPRFLRTIPLILREVPQINKQCPTPIVTAIIGRFITLECPARGNPVVDWVWFRMGVAVTTGGRVTLQADGALLTIDPAEMADAGLYTCTVSNTINGQTFNDTYDILLDVENPPSPPYFTYRPQSITVLAGSRAMLLCGGGGNPAPTVTWKRLPSMSRLLYDGVPELVSLNSRISVTPFSLVFSEVLLEDEGFYICTISSSLGQRSSKLVLLNVLQSPTVTTSQSAVEADANATVVLDCSATGDPLPVIHWLVLPSLTVLPSLDYPRYIVAGTNLTILNVQASDSGTLRCWAANAGGQTFSDVTLVVIAPPVASVLPRNATVFEGCQASFTCSERGGAPPLNFRWLRNDVELQNDDTVSILTSGELLLTDVRQNDTGNYTCEVFGRSGSSRNTSLLIVTRPQPIGVPDPPILSSTPSLQVVSMGGLAQFVCLTRIDPSPEVTWLKDGVSVNNLSNVEVLLNEALYVANVTLGDAGTYTCLVNTSEGEVMEEFQLVVSVAPVIESHPSSQVVEEHLFLNLTCVVSGIPTPVITWFINDSLLMEDARRSVDQYGNLVLADPQVPHSGQYTCAARNDAGVTQITFSVDVVSAIFEVLEEPTSMVVYSGESIIQDCVVYPVIPVSWTKDSRPVTACPGDRVCVSGGSIYIASALLQDAGFYTCSYVHRNQLNTFTAHVTVRPSTLPVFTLYPIPLSLTSGSGGNLTCGAEGAPPPIITWKLDGGAIEDPLIEIMNGNLIITSANSNTTGIYTCVATNAAGIIEVSVLVELIDKNITGQLDNGNVSPPFLTSAPAGLVFLSPGQSTSLDCVATGNPAPNITWTRNNKPIQISPNIYVAKNGSLILKEVRGPEDGNYTCKAVNAEGVHSAVITVRVLNPFGQNSIPAESSEKFSVTALLGADVFLDCGDNVVVTNSSDVMWRRGSELLCGERVRVLGNGSLVLSRVVGGDVGVYECLMFHSGRRVAHSYTHLSVLPRKEPPYFLEKPRDSHVVKTGYLILCCQATSPGGEETRLQWYQDHTPLSRRGEKHLVLKNGSLLLSNVFPAQAGNYSCEASNIHGWSLASAIVTVSRAPVDKFVTVQEGHQLTLDCELGQDSVWVKDRRKVVASQAGSVTVAEAYQTHAGEYTCSQGSNSLNYFVTVQVPPKILSPTGSISVLLGGVASLDCLATGSPTPVVSWYHGEVMLEKGDRHSILTNGTLLLYRASKTDRGTYVCTAANVLGTVQIIKYINVNR